ncbi:Kelch-Like Protein 9 [Manis pentadactyla]|nr:Kelch-Like Protein 9 [Manis pentadactyla]
MELQSRAYNPCAQAVCWSSSSLFSFKEPVTEKISPLSRRRNQVNLTSESPARLKPRPLAPGRTFLRLAAVLSHAASAGAGTPEPSSGHVRRGQLCTLDRCSPRMN